MSNVALIRFVCFAVFLLRFFNFCLLYSFSATIRDDEMKLYIQATWHDSAPMLYASAECITDIKLCPDPVLPLTSQPEYTPFSHCLFLANNII